MKTVKKIALGALTVLFATGLTFGVNATAASAEALTDEQIVQALVPIREDYGKAVGSLIKADDGTVYQNYEMGYVYATLTENGEKLWNMRSVGGMNVTETDGEVEKEYLTDKMEAWIRARGVETEIPGRWQKLASEFGVELSYSATYLFDKIYEEYVRLTEEEGFNPGLPTSAISDWDDSVIKLDFYDGDGKYGFGGDRVYVTTIAYSFQKDRAFYIADEVFNFYKESKAGTLSEPITNPFEYTLNGEEGMVQAFAKGYVFCPDNGGNVVIRSQAVWNEETEKFDPIELDEATIKATELTDIEIESNGYYGGKGLTVEEVQTLFFLKYDELIAKGFNPGMPDHEGIFYWDGLFIKQAYVGSDGTGNAWGRTNLMLYLNPDDQKVYVVKDEILNAIDEAALGLGNAASLGYPLGDEKTAKIGGYTYHYQEFSEGTIYSIENNPQLTRFVKGKNWAQITATKAPTPNNPLFDGSDEVGGSSCESSIGLLSGCAVLAAAGIATIRKTKKEQNGREE